jgi:hypothetical protein
MTDEEMRFLKIFSDTDKKLRDEETQNNIINALISIAGGNVDAEADANQKKNCLTHELMKAQKAFREEATLEHSKELSKAERSYRDAYEEWLKIYRSNTSLAEELLHKIRRN